MKKSVKIVVFWQQHMPFKLKLGMRGYTTSPLSHAIFGMIGEWCIQNPYFKIWAISRYFCGFYMPLLCIDHSVLQWYVDRYGQFSGLVAASHHCLHFVVDIFSQ